MSTTEKSVRSYRMGMLLTYAGRCAIVLPSIVGNALILRNQLMTGLPDFALGVVVC